jgi:nucleotide-binding universal stress UspA family protein
MEGAMRILLAVDGSDNSYEALRILTHLARAEQLILLHALDVPQPTYPMMMPEVARDIYTTVEKEMREDGERLLDRMASLLPMNVGPATKRIEVGTPSEAIVNVAQETGTDLIVLGARGLGPIKERLFGSVSHRVLTHASCATLIVTGPVRSIKQILLPLQGPDDAGAAIRFLTTTPFREPVDLMLVTVLPFAQPLWPAGISVTEAMKEQVLQSARAFLDDVAGKLTGLGYRARSATLLGAPAPMILHEASKLNPDLILMGSRGRGGLTRFVLGSTSHAVLHQAPCPVLVFR